MTHSVVPLRVLSHPGKENTTRLGSRDSNCSDTETAPLSVFAIRTNSMRTSSSVIMKNVLVLIYFIITLL